jgi:hypothetical protein
MDSPITWLAARTPPAPDELEAWLNIPDDGTELAGGVDWVPTALLKAALVHLDDAVARPGRDREAAYQLLAADALITYGCEAASEATDVRGALVEVFVAVRAGGAGE